MVTTTMAAAIKVARGNMLPQVGESFFGDVPESSDESIGPEVVLMYLKSEKSLTHGRLEAATNGL
jgi:hypothetical protein